MVNLLSMGNITSGYGQRPRPTVGASTNHKGIDIVLSNDNVPAVLGGKVLYSGFSNSAGNYIKIQQTDGNIATYMHLAKPANYKSGAVVKEGDIIGVQGSTGVSTGKHLHFQVENDSGFIDPQKYFSNSSAFSTVSTELSTEKENSSFAMNLVGHIIQFIAIIFVFVLATIFFFKAFDIKI